MGRRIDLNCDMGEGFGAYRIGDDLALLDHVTSANIACGFHAGDPSTMQRVVGAALAKGVRVGAHPGLPDLQGFGRRAMRVTPGEVYAMVVYQVGALSGFARALGGALNHVKAHGALYNMAAKDPALADAIVGAVRDIDPKLMLFALAGSEMIRSAERGGIPFASEVFADRTYQNDGSLSPRDLPGSVIEDIDAAMRQVRQMVEKGTVRSLQGVDVPVRADTLCIHGDQPGAVAFARKIRGDLTAIGVEVVAPVLKQGPISWNT